LPKYLIGWGKYFSGNVPIILTDMMQPLMKDRYLYEGCKEAWDGLRLRQGEGGGG
jgi:hypothetical protein